jgi:tRNA G18 (ribose-2'-O)-methylase SpoU
MDRGYFGIGICHCKSRCNVGTLWRSAALLGASFIFTVGRRYRAQSSDTLKTPRHIPLFHHETLQQLKESLPWSAPLVGVELDERAEMVTEFRHPERAVYLLGAEDHGLTREERDACHALIQLPGEFSMNVSVAGSIVMFDRWQKRKAPTAAQAAE